MNRLTEKREKPLTTKWKDVPTSYYKIKGDNTGVAISEIERLNKLGKLEDLEEQLCCPLEAVIKAIIQNCFYDGSDYKETNIGLIDQEGDLGIVISVEEWEYGNTMYLKDYKNTWWLKEDKSE